LLLKILSWCPGVLGFLLRQKLYPFFLNQSGQNVLFGRFVTLQGAQHICIGNGVVVNDYAILDASNCKLPGAGIIIEDNVFIGGGTKLLSLGEKIIIRRGANLGSECRVLADKKTIIGGEALFAAYCRIGGTHSKHSKVSDTSKKNIDQQEDQITQIGYGCWLGVRTLFHSGAQIEEGTIIGAHSIVKSRFPEEVVAFGNPAKIVYHRKNNSIS